MCLEAVVRTFVPQYFSVLFALSLFLRVEKKQTFAF